MGKRRGVTLVEVMVGILLSGVVLGAGYQIWSATRRDVALASTRQMLASQVRRALDVMAKDFQAMKAGTLEVTPGADGESATIKFERFPLKNEGTSIGVDNTELVIYQYRKPRLTRTVRGQGERPLAWHLDSLELARGGRGAFEPGGINDIPPDQDGRNARMDILMTASSLVPGSKRIATFSAHVSVFMREEYYATANKSRFIAMSRLVATNPANLRDQDRDDSMLTMGLLDPEALARLSREQLNELYRKETEALAQTRQQIEELNSNISDIDTRTTGRLSWNPANWFSWPTEITDIQRDIQRHTTSAAVASDIKKLDEKIAQYEQDNLRDSFSRTVPGFQNLDRNSQQYKDLKEVYDLMVRDRTMRKAHEMAQRDLPADQRTAYRSLLEDFNPASLVRGQLPGNPPTTFNETEEQFQARRAKAQMIQDNKGKVDLSWMDSDEGADRVKIYTAAKDLKDLAETKKAYLESKETHETNLTNIRNAQNRAP
ncbi:MAG: hypothetical protein OZSIB_4222 [Candidatus Ozemobacter sibiricus]|jgi:prepilin-type N-terminal cleavage/methylation domain-containing protein|uniref:Prepilin-type N-terminal cleavage/methylation domain-containing protein n=1 Tax=Candidatus Ozemobacter sibiricus TaxID=2268124 RepID=A0A367ZMW4_9BACT|nr:MAG: hypothetical protein OZSIB_4222 [Candidatus Ozemobacter sibiricus]